MVNMYEVFPGIEANVESKSLDVFVKEFILVKCSI